MKVESIVGNPPYIRIHNIMEYQSVIKSLEFTKNGMTDSFIAFFDLCRKICQNICLITPSSYFTSDTAESFRRWIVDNRLLREIVDFKHEPVFDVSTYPCITYICTDNNSVTYSSPDNHIIINHDEFMICDKFFFGNKEQLTPIKEISRNTKKSPFEVKVGVQTSADSVYIGSFGDKLELSIPAIKASTLQITQIVFPYKEDGTIFSEEELKKNEHTFNYFLCHQNELVKRDIEDKSVWWQFGRSQGIVDVFKDKLSLNFLYRDVNDIKISYVPRGVAIFGGLYIIGDTDKFDSVTEALKSEEYLLYVKSLGKYKSGGYYAISAKDVQKYLDWKLGE